MSNLIEMSGGGPQKQPKYVPIFMDRSFTGIFTQRNVLHDPSDVITAKYYGGRPDALWQGRNVELTNRLTLQRRPGLIQFSAATYATPPNRAFAFQLVDGTIRVIVDTSSTGSLVLTSVANASAGTTVYTGTITGGAANALAGLSFLVAGFTNTPNNGTYLCTASTATTLTLSNTSGLSETNPATAVSAGGVYWDQQNGAKTLLFAKSPGAGQTYFQAVAGILYMGDGIDTRKYTPLNLNLPPGSGVSVWNWGIVAPTTQPGVTIVPSASSSVQWTGTPPVLWSTMGLVFDTANSAMYQLNSVNATTTNTTRFGVSGDGQPAWNQTPGGTTGPDGTITWTNRGPIVLWTANTVYNNATVGGTLTNPCVIYDPKTKSCFLNANPGLASGTSGNVYPNFVGGVGQYLHDAGVKWFCMGPGGVPGPWKKSTSYPQVGTVNNNQTGSSIVEPSSLANGLPSSPPTFWQVSGGGTSAGSATSPFSASTNSFGSLTTDGDLIWLSLGSGVWTATTAYSQWRVNGTAFSAIKDSNNNFQVCISTGTSAARQPGTSYSITSVANASGGTTVYTYGATTAMPAGDSLHPVFVTFSGFAQAANNGSFRIVSSTATTVTVANASGVVDTTGTGIYNAWGTGYGNVTRDGTAVWTCVGTSTSWATATKWFLPAAGFSPPSPSSPFGGASVVDSNSNVQFIINSGLGGSSTPTWAAKGLYTADGGTPLVLTQVTVSGVNTTYTGTITGGAANAFVGQQFLIAGFTNAGNNGLVIVTSSTATTLVCTTASQANETHAGTATTGALWYDLVAFSANSVAWKLGHVYAYSFKARAFNDFYSVPFNNALPIPPGSPTGNPLPTPTGSATNAVSTASPVFTIVGANTGAVNTITGFGSLDPQVDTIVIWRDADGGGIGQMFELTEIPAPPPIGGIAQPWSFQDFLPDSATSLFPGLNTSIPAPIASANNPPDSAFLPMAYNFQRIWGADGQVVPFSGGPDTKVGNPNECFAPTNSLPFLAPVVRIVKTPQGLVTFLTDSIEVISGGPLTSSFFSVTWAPGMGLRSFNMLDVLAGEIYFFSADNQFRIMTPSLNISNAGFALGDQFANLPSSGVSDATWDASKGYVASHQNGIDNCIFVADGSTGWYRLNPRQAGAQPSTEPVWSPFATITGGCKMVQSVETSPGQKRLLVGASAVSQSILQRSLSVFTDNGSQFNAFFVMGSITLAHPGQLAVLKFMEFDFSGVSFRPTISYLLNEISGAFTPFTALPQFDPPSLYGTTASPSSYSPNRYYFLGNGSLARCRHLQIKVDFGTTATADEMYNATIFGRLMIET